MTKKILISTVFLGVLISTKAQQKGMSGSNIISTNNIPISNADLGVFPYIKTLPNFKPTNESDSLTIEQNRTYFYDGKAFFTIDGKVSAQKLNVKDATKPIPSEFQIIQEFDRIVSTLGGKKIYEGKFPESQFKKIANYAELDSRQQVAPNTQSYGVYDGGVAEYVIKTPKKEVWIQLVSSSIKSKFYNLLVVEKQNQLLTINTNKQNFILKDLEKDSKAITYLLFDLDKATLLSESKDELLNIIAIFQAHPNWKIRIEVNNAPIGKSDYTLALTERRALAIKDELISLGINPTLVETKGFGETKQLVPNDTEKGRQTNTRVEIIKL